jgi:hypothetical protein
MIADECTNPGKIISKMSLPGEIANRVRGKRDDIRGYPEKEHPFVYIKFQNFFKTCKIFLNGFNETFIRIGSEPECPGWRAANGAVEAGISNAHGWSPGRLPVT